MKIRSDASTAAPTGRTMPLAILVAVLPSPLTRHSTPFGLSGMRMSPFDNSGPMPSIPAPPLAFGNARQTLTACDWKSIAIRTTRLRPCSATRRGPDPYCRPCCTIPSGSLRPAARRSTDPSELRIETVPAVMSLKYRRASRPKARSSGAGRFLTTSCGPPSAAVDGQAASGDVDGLGAAVGLGDATTGAC